LALVLFVYAPFFVTSLGDVVDIMEYVLVRKDGYMLLVFGF